MKSVSVDELVNMMVKKNQPEHRSLYQLSTVLQTAGSLTDTTVNTVAQATPDAVAPTSSFTIPSDTVVFTVPPTYQPSDSDTARKPTASNNASSTPTADPLSSSSSTPFRA